MARRTDHHDHRLSQDALRGHIPALDGLRGVAILLVLLFHCTDMTASGVLDNAVATTFRWGAYGVDLFFVLSGFLITGILADARGKPGFFSSFYMRRVLRIFPLYYLIVAFSFLVLPNLGTVLAGAPGVSGSTAELVQSKIDRFGQVSGDEWYYWLYLSNFVVAKADTFRHGILDVSWSLSIEEQFYVAWPLLLFFLGALRMRWVCLALLIIAPLFRVWLLGRSVDPLFGGEPTLIDALMYTPGRLEGIALGALLALHLRAGSGRFDPEKRLRSLAPLCKVAAPTLLVASLLVEWGRFTGAADPLDATYNGVVFGVSLVAYGFCALFVLALLAKPGSRWYRLWTWAPLRSFGKYSYAIYLLHLPIRAVIRDLVYGPNFNGERFGDALVTFPTVMGSELPGQLLFYIPAFGACWLAGWLSWHCFEKHVLKLKRFFPYGKRS
ncbi:MAG: acyltransferase [Phycisphaerales bacterium]